MIFSAQIDRKSPAEFERKHDFFSPNRPKIASRVLTKTCFFTHFQFSLVFYSFPIQFNWTELEMSAVYISPSNERTDGRTDGRPSDGQKIFGRSDGRKIFRRTENFRTVGRTEKFRTDGKNSDGWTDGKSLVGRNIFGRSDRLCVKETQEQKKRNFEQAKGDQG